MSWDGYIKTLTDTGIDRAAIYSAAGDSCWAQSSGFSLAANEIQEIVKGFTDPSGLQSNGLHVSGEKYFLLRADNRSIYGRHGESGVVIVKTNLAFIVAHYSPPVQAGAAANTVEKLADYLISSNY